MIGLGAVNAVNFDGGGSTVFYWTPGGAQTPTESARLLKILENARVPRRQPNPRPPDVQVTRQAPTQPPDLRR
jgi:hypothetical protein